MRIFTNHLDLHTATIHLEKSSRSGNQSITNRVHIDAPAGIIDIEGERDFVEGLLSRLYPLIEQIGFGSAPSSDGESQVVENHASSSNMETSTEDQQKPKIKRRRGSTPPKGQSCADRILALKADNFFKQHRVGSDIVAGLKEKGWTHKSNQIAAAAGKLFERGLLQRTKEGNGSFRYYWDRD
jgi:hypothetical protein